SYGPTRLTAEQSQQLQYDLNSANLEKQRLQSELNQQGRQLSEVTTRLEQTTEELEKVSQELARMRADIKMFADSLPPDPRGTSRGVLARGRRSVGGNLAYRILVILDNENESFKGNVVLVVAGRSSNREAGDLNLPASADEFDHGIHIQGEEALP